MYVCLCYGISQSEVKKIIKNGALTPEEVQKQCGAGMGCGCCLEALETLINEEGVTKSHAHATAAQDNSPNQGPL